MDGLSRSKSIIDFRSQKSRSGLQVLKFVCCCQDVSFGCLGKTIVCAKIFDCVL